MNPVSVRIPYFQSLDAPRPGQGHAPLLKELITTEAWCCGASFGMVVVIAVSPEITACQQGAGV